MRPRTHGHNQQDNAAKAGDQDTGGAGQLELGQPHEFNSQPAVRRWGCRAIAEPERKNFQIARLVRLHLVAAPQLVSATAHIPAGQVDRAFGNSDEEV